MSRSVHRNFAARLIERLSENSRLVDAASGEVVAAQELRGVVADFAAGFSSAGLQFGERVLIACNVSPLSSLAYLGAMMSGMVAVPVNESALLASAEALCAKTRARALWSERQGRYEWADRSGLVQFAGRPQTARSGRPQPAACGDDDLAALMTTSGSTGVPRLVQVSHGNMIASVLAIRLP